MELVTRMNQAMDTNQFRNILVGVNGTRGCENAIEIAVSLARSLGSRVILLGVIAPLSPESQAEGVGLDDASLARTQLEEQVRNSGEIARNLGIDVVAEIVEGFPEEEIERKAGEASADLIVVGYRDVGRVRRWLEGSTSELLVRSSRASVLVVHDDSPQ